MRVLLGFPVALSSLLLLVCVASACGDDDSSDRACAPGASVSCTGEGACEGFQTCDEDGRGFGACECDEPGQSHGDSGVAGSGGTSGGGGGRGGAGGSSSSAGHDASGAGGMDAGPHPNDDAGPSQGQDAGFDAGHDAGPDAGPGFGSFDCNPLSGTGCAADQRCTWVGPLDDGTLSCLPDGTAGDGDACTRDGDGVDDCEAGLVCIDGACTPGCDLDGTSCAPDGYCVEYVGLFDDGSGSLAGACRLGCDPVTQLTSASADCPGAQDGCYLGPTGATCVNIGSQVLSRTQGYAVGASAFSNSCAPGFAPIEDAAGSFICTAFCTPVESWSGSSANLGGEAPSTCAARGASGQECRFAWFFAQQDGLLALDNVLLDSVGLCVDLAGREYDSNDNGSPDTPWPSCASLANTDTNGDDVRDHERWGCAPRVP